MITGLGVGGAESALASLVLYRLAASSRCDAVASLLPGGETASRLREAGIPVADLGTRSTLHLPLAVARLASLLRRVRPEVVQGWMYHGNLAATVALRLAGLRSSTGLVWGIRCADLPPEFCSRQLRLAVRLSARWSGDPDVIAVNSAAGLRHHERLGFRPRRWVRVSNGIEVDRFRPDQRERARVRRELGIDPGAIVVVHPARVDPVKDHRTLLEAAARIPQVPILLVGAGTECLDVPPNVTALGRRADLAAVFAAADVVVLSSVSEGSPRALLEGMASGLLPVATDVGDVAEIVAGIGEVVPVRSPDRLGLALAHRFAHPEETRRLGALARSRVLERYTIEQSGAAFDEIHRDAVLTGAWR